MAAYDDGLFRPTNQTSREAVRGTYQAQQQKPKAEAPAYDQKWHDSAFNIARGYVKGRDNLSPLKDRDAARNVLKLGGHAGKLQNSVAKNSPYLQAKYKNNPATAHKEAGKIVANAYKKNLDNAPRDPQQNVKPGQETHRGQSPAPSSQQQAKSQQSSQKAAKPSMSAQMAAYQHRNRTIGR